MVLRGDELSGAPPSSSRRYHLRNTVAPPSSSRRYHLRNTVAREAQKVSPPPRSKAPKKRKLDIPDDPSADMVPTVIDVEKSAHAMVTETLRTFNKLYLLCIQEEEKRCARQEATDNKGSPKGVSKSKVYFTRSRIPKSLSEIQGLACADITGGLEDIPILVTNLVDELPISPLDFVYIKDMKFSKNISSPTIASKGCNCQGTCTDSRRCTCAKLNGGDFPYVHRDGGRLVEPKAVVFECGPNCGCGPSCVNRTSQNGLKFHLEVFRTPKKGWGVRSLDHIPSGSAVCEYIGVVKRTDDLDPAGDNSYVIDIDCLQTMVGLDGRESRLRDVSLPSYLTKLSKEASESVPFCIDAGKTGNVARFINHSCQPNLFIQCVLSCHHDLKLARLVLIAADNIPPLKELSYDYGYGIDSVLSLDGKIRQLPCFCGAQDCSKRLY